MKHICVLPWISIDRNRTRASDEISLTPCCLYESKQSHTDIKEYWNSKEIVNLRTEFLEGKMPDGCRLCWDNERKGFKSLRQSVNKGRLQTYKSRLWQTKLQQKPAQVKYTAGTQCNLACRMCLPTFSTKVKKVWEIVERKANTEVDDLLDNADYILANRHSVDYIDITGGEPFFHKNVKKLLHELIRTNDNKHITLHIVTNATRIDQHTVNLLKQFKDVVLSISMDGVGKVQEYIRPGCSWETLENNIRLLKQNNFSLQVVSTISVLNIIHLEDLETWCKYNDMHWANPAPIYNPAEFSPHNLPFQLHDDVPEKYKKYLNRGMTEDPVNFIKDLDRYWGTDIVKYMPEWDKVFNNLHWRNSNKLVNMEQVARRYVG
jgi:MoaA/NifB/PqqE/SkfB family radical SAM enzyme